MARQVPGRFVLPAREPRPAPELRGRERLDGDRAARGWTRLRGGRSMRMHDLFPSFFGVKKTELAVFSRQLATFIGAGVPLTQSIEVLRQETRTAKMRDVLSAIHEDLSKGASVSDSFARFPEVFSPLYLNLIRAAEMTGTLDVVLKRLDVQLSREYRASKEIRSAMTYPIIVLLMAFGAVGVLVGFVLPRFAGLFAAFHAELPGTTKFLLDSSTFATEYRLQIIVAIVAFLVVMIGSQSVEAGRVVRDRLILLTPVIGTLARYAAVARFCRTLSAMLEAGVPMSRSFDIVLGSVSNRILARRLVPVKARMLAGEGFAAPLADSGVFPPTVIQMVRVGEETGALERFLGEAAEFYENELEYKLQGAIQLLEPALMLGVGGVVGFVAISMVSAIYALTGAIH
ncbi:MAG: type II secretion system F family protein [Candidatus Limnocylindria bacterium]